MINTTLQISNFVHAPIFLLFKLFVHNLNMKNSMYTLEIKVTTQDIFSFGNHSAINLNLISRSDSAFEVSWDMYFKSSWQDR